MQTIKDFFIKNKSIVIANVVLAIITVVFLWASPAKDIKDYYVSRSDNANDFEYSVFHDVVLMQEFTCNCKGADEIELGVTTAKDANYGSFSVSLSEADGKVLQKWTTDKRKLVDNDWVEYKLDKPLEKGKTYDLLILAEDLDKNNSIQVKGTATQNLINKDENITYVNCYYNGASDSSVAFSLAKTHTNVFGYIAILLVFAVLNIYWTNRGKNVERYAFVIIFLLGLVMMLLLTPGAGPDEDFHYNSSLQMSNIMLGREAVNEIEKEYNFNYEVHTNANRNYLKLWKGLGRGARKTDTKEIIGDRSHKQMTYPVSWLPQSLGITIGRVLKWSGPVTYMFARLMNLLVYAVLCHFAIKLLPIKKELLFIYCINPITMQQASSLSYDVIINGLSLLFFVLVIKLIVEKKEILWSDIAKLLVLLLLFGPIKTVYFAHVLLLLFIPLSQFKNWKDKALKVGVSFAGISLATVSAIIYDKASVISGRAVATIVSNSPSESTFVMPDRAEYYGVADVFSEPSTFIKLFFNSINHDFVDRFEELFGSKFSSMIRPYGYIVLIYLVVLFLCIYREGEENTYLETRTRFGLLSAASIETLLIVAAGFLMTPYGYKYIEGLQGRYFSPCLSMFIYGMRGKTIKVRINTNVIMYMICFIYLCVSTGLMTYMVY